MTISRLLGSLKSTLFLRFIAGNMGVSSTSLAFNTFATTVRGDGTERRVLGVELVRSSSDEESPFELERVKKYLVQRVHRPCLCTTIDL